jgi:hypothetical protein
VNTTKAVLDLLPIVADQGWVLHKHAIRNRDFHTPLWALAQAIHPGWSGSGEQMAALFGVPYRRLRPLWMATDNPKAWYRPQLVGILQPVPLPMMMTIITATGVPLVVTANCVEIGGIVSSISSARRVLRDPRLEPRIKDALAAAIRVAARWGRDA